MCTQEREHRVPTTTSHNSPRKRGQSPKPVKGRHRKQRAGHGTECGLAQEAPGSCCISFSKDNLHYPSGFCLSPRTKDGRISSFPPVLLITHCPSSQELASSFQNKGAKAKGRNPPGSWLWKHPRLDVVTTHHPCCLHPPPPWARQPPRGHLSPMGLWSRMKLSLP
jgi:hypothetical protein